MRSDADFPAPRAVLADDERLMRDQLRARLAEVWPELQIVAEAKNGLEAVALVDEHRPDIVFLDIRMPGLTGVEAARQIAQLPPRAGNGADTEDDADLLPEIVFITAYDQYAVEAFEQGVADYVLKPAERDRLLRDGAAHPEAAGRPARGWRPRGRAAEPAAAAAAAHAGGQAEPGRRAAVPAVDPGHGGPGDPDDPGRRRAVLRQRREVHAGADGTGRGADPQADQGAGRRGRSASSSGRSTAARWST